MQTLPCVRPVGVEPHIEPGRWISSRDALQLVGQAYMHHDPIEYATDEIQRCAARDNATEAILRRLTQGSLLARAVDFAFTSDLEDWHPTKWSLDEPAGTIPKTFWSELKSRGRFATQDWIAGDFTFGDSGAPFENSTGYALGVQFDPSALPATSSASAPNEQKVHAITTRGARRKWDWDGAFLHLAAVAHHSPDGLLREDGGEPNQSDIGRHLADWFIGTAGDTPEDSQLRSYGRRFVEELNALKLLDANKSRVAG
ncbi:hypothetical protein JI743_02985 [Sphingopyxis sp. DHUNG17]|uniref:hypothetical protein n=1 Tax=Sphingopyxis jiangsuensis TaxID=2871171 RepID=UPI00192025CE|nr:hypothetical protein [Sphingopyxis lutea]MBL0767767.1 hypothetical protein [Sphingopyxis lutea]